MPPKKSGPSAGVMVLIVIVLLLGCIATAAAGWLGYHFLVVGRSPGTAGSDATPAPGTGAPGTKPGGSSEGSVANPVPEKGAPPVEQPGSGKYAVVTEAEARDVVARFITLRAKGDIEGSKALCTVRMLKGPDGDFVSDPYWNPESFKIVKVTPDQMYMQVASMGVWPSGEEPTIFSVFREPETGQVLIDGLIDPEVSPELFKP